MACMAVASAGTPASSRPRSSCHRPFCSICAVRRSMRRKNAARSASSSPIQTGAYLGGSPASRDYVGDGLAGLPKTSSARITRLRFSGWMLAAACGSTPTQTLHERLDALLLCKLPSAPRAAPVAGTAQTAARQRANRRKAPFRRRGSRACPGAECPARSGRRRAHSGRRNRLARVEEADHMMLHAPHLLLRRAAVPTVMPR